MKTKNHEKFTVLVRVKPQTTSRILKGDQGTQILTATQKTVLISRKNNEEKLFRFNRVFAAGTDSEQQVYSQCAHLVTSLFQGHNSTFLAYGQTGTGKTYTIFGEDYLVNQGILYRSVQHLFHIIKQRMNSRQFAVRVSFLQFYLQGIYDLLQNNQKKLEIKQTLDDGIHIKDLNQASVKSASELMQVIKYAIKIRKTQQTSSNKRSSRSHAIIQINLLQRWNEGSQTKYLKGILKIVDLAGSQRVSKTESNGSRLQEAKRINKQITTLGKCINMLAIAQKQPKPFLSDKFNFNKFHVPYRDCKITRYLSQSLGGKAKVVLCVCISKYSANIQQSFSSLLFASQASTLKIQSKRNEVYSLSKSVQKLKQNMNNDISKTKSPIKKKLTFQLSESKAQISETKKQQLIQKFKTEIDEIQAYLQKKQIKCASNQSENNTISQYAKIFSVLRRKYQSSKNSVYPYLQS